MNEMITRSLVVLAGALTLAAGADEREFIRKSFRNLTPAARTRLAEDDHAGKAWKAQSARPAMFVRGQFFYGLERGNYLHNWYERPLHQDSSLQDFSVRGSRINPKSWIRNVAIARDMHLDGFAFFPSNPGCWDVLPRSQSEGGEITILPELHNGDTGKGVEHCLGVLERLLKDAPNCFRLNDRIVITCYPPMVAPWQGPSLEFWGKLKAAAKEKFGGDRFCFMPYAYLFNSRDLDRPESDVALIEHAEEIIRNVLRVTDGLFYQLTESAWAPASLLREPHDTIVLPIVRKVMSEPEFKDKYLGMGYWQAHENCYRRFGDKPSFGFKRLISALNSIDLMRPDFSVAFEWDEENENTHFRPTVSNGQTTQRILRYYADRWAGAKPQPYPTDQATDIPNLALAYRKSLECGETLAAQVLNIPDGTALDAELKVSFRWKSNDGKVVREFPARRLRTAELDLVEFECPSEELIDQHLLVPELTVEGGRTGKRVFAEGFWPLALEANRNIDSKWVRQALREITPDVRAKLEVEPAAADGTIRVSGEIAGPVKFRSIEVLEGSDTVYMHDANEPEGRPDDDRVSVAITFLSQATFWKLHSATGFIRTLNAPHAVHRDRIPHFVRRQGQDCCFDNKPVRFNFQNTHWIDIPMSEADAAMVEIHIPEVMPVKRIPIRELMRDDVYSWGLNGGGQVVIRRELTAREIPRPVLAASAKFSFKMKKRNPLSVLRLQAIDENYRVWRGCGHDGVRPSGKTVTYHVYSESMRTGQVVKVDAARIVSLKYDFRDAHGDAWYPKGGWWDLPCAGGGGVGAITGLGAGDNNGYSYCLNHVFDDLREKDGTACTVPVRVQEPDGSCALKFSGHAFASLPLNFNPRQSGFAITLKVWPESLEGEQGLFDSGNVGFSLRLVNGEPTAFVCLAPEMARRGLNDTAGLTVRGPKLTAGRWNTLRFVFDQQAAWIETDGLAGERAFGCGNSYNSGCMTFGMFVRGLKPFHGKVADLTLEPR